jgi:hypothetical protein
VIDRFEVEEKRSDSQSNKDQDTIIVYVHASSFHLIVAGGSRGEGMTMLSIGTRAERIGAEKLAICI